MHTPEYTHGNTIRSAEYLHIRPFRRSPHTCPVRPGEPAGGRHSTRPRLISLSLRGEKSSPRCSGCGSDCVYLSSFNSSAASSLPPCQTLFPIFFPPFLPKAAGHTEVCEALLRRRLLPPLTCCTLIVVARR